LGRLHDQTAGLAYTGFSFQDSARWIANVRGDKEPDPTATVDLTSLTGTASYTDLVTRWHEAHPLLPTYAATWDQPSTLFGQTADQPSTPLTVFGGGGSPSSPLTLPPARPIGYSGLTPGLAGEVAALESLSPEQVAIVRGVNRSWISHGWQGIYDYWKATDLFPPLNAQWRMDLLVNVKTFAKVEPAYAARLQTEINAQAANDFHHL
jgi:hypothetical protein